MALAPAPVVVSAPALPPEVKVPPFSQVRTTHVGSRHKCRWEQFYQEEKCFKLRRRGLDFFFWLLHCVPPQSNITHSEVLISLPQKKAPEILGKKPDVGMWGPSRPVKGNQVRSIQGGTKYSFCSLSFAKQKFFLAVGT